MLANVKHITLGQINKPKLLNRIFESRGTAANGHREKERRGGEGGGKSARL